MNLRVLSYTTLVSALFFTQQTAHSSDVKAAHCPKVETVAMHLTAGAVSKALTEVFQVPLVEHNVQVVRFFPDLKLTTKIDTSTGTHDTCEYHTNGSQKLFEISLKKTNNAAAHCPKVEVAAKFLGGASKALKEVFQVPLVENNVQAVHFSPDLKLTTKIDTSTSTHDTCEYYTNGSQKLFEISINKSKK